MSIEVGSIVEGKVVRIKPFGAIVLIGDNLQGLVHISHISDSFVQDINNHLSIGDVINVKVLSVDAQNNKISLSIKEAMRELNIKDGNEQDNTSHTRSEANTPPTFSESKDPTQAFEDKFKEWLKASNERHAGINKRNKRR
ncbi:MAG: S1 RNA-binding domain-containing protein [Clostridiales bacterium]|jgi:general stress protein 13/S1 RNA binding domain protein|nr:S1 RNA-binding domain-containing protein [Clostridiales bacterium]